MGNFAVWPRLAGQRRSQCSPKLTSEAVGQGCDENGDRLEACWDDSAFR